MVKRLDLKHTKALAISQGWLICNMILEVVPIYKTQYYLSVKSNSLDIANNENGTGWYNRGDEAQFLWI